MRLVIERGDDADGHKAAAVTRDGNVLKGFYVNPWLPWTWSPVARAKAWALSKGFGCLPVVDADTTIMGG